MGIPPGLSGSLAFFPALWPFSGSLAFFWLFSGSPAFLFRRVRSWLSIRLSIVQLSELRGSPEEIDPTN